MHLDFDHAIALASLTSSTFDVKAETARPITTHATFWHLREQVLDIGNQDANRGALPGAEVAGRAVGLVVELVRRGSDALFQVRADPSQHPEKAVINWRLEMVSSFFTANV